MNGSRFDHWTTSLTPPISRRSTLRGLLGGTGFLVALLAPVATPADTEAKKKKRKKKKRCKGGTRQCGKACIPADACCTDADCDAPAACIGGKCAVPCGQPCDDLVGVCATSVDGAEVCTGAQLIDILCAASPCTADSQCDATEFCSAAGCPPVGGVTNRCQELLLP